MIDTIEYIISESPRAKNIGFCISLRKGLIITIPKGFKRSKLDKIIADKKPWITKHLSAIEQRRIDLNINPAQENALPQTLNLLSINQQYQLVYRLTTAANVKVNERDNELVIYGAIKNHKACIVALSNWLHHKAIAELNPWLKIKSKQWDLPFASMRVRNQTSRWGSCSARKTISLNRKLLFVPEQLVEYIMLHELCHTVHLNHSAKFWTLVASINPDYKTSEQAIKDGAWERYIPHWV